MNINEFLRAFLDSAAVSIYVVDRATDEILLVNDYYARHIGVSKKYMEMHKCWEFVDPIGGRCSFCPRNPEAEIGNPQKEESACVAQAFNPTLGIWGRYTAYPVAWIDGREADLITMADISNEKLLSDRLEQLAYYDKVTGLPNLARLELDMSDRNTNDYCAVAFGKFALRNFNVKYGRKSGDTVLRVVSEWTQNLGLQDTNIYRMDGNAFCMIIYNAALPSALSLAGKMRERFQQTWELPLNGTPEHVNVDISLCVADGRRGFADADALVSALELTLALSESEHRIAVCGEA